MKEPMEDCPRFSRCSVNDCPLYSKYGRTDLYSPYDKERVCTLGKTRRLRIAADYPGVLKYEGMRTREYHAKQRYDRLSDDEKERMKEQVRTLQKRQLARKS